MSTGTPLRVGLVGAGGISHVHLQSLLRLGAEVVLFSRSGAADLARQYGGAVADSLEDLLDRVDYVDVVTPTSTHHAFIRRALEAGKDVISEKPLARTDEEARELLHLSVALGRRLHPAHVVRFFPEYVQLRRAVEAGLLGELAVLRFFRSGAFPRARAWFAEPALSGGIIMDQMIHDLDAARWIAGEVVRVSAVRSRRSEPAVEAAHVLLTHESGAISQLSGVWGPAHLRFTTGYSVTGTGGTLEHDSAAERPYLADLLATPGGGDALPDSDALESPYYLELREFLLAGQGGHPPRVSAQDGVEAVRIANAAIESARRGRPVDLAPTGDDR